MQDVCRSHGVLFILDEVMCGLGRTGSMHAYQQHEGVVPDILLLGKGLAGGYAPLSAMLVGEKIASALWSGSGTGSFNHGHTFQNHAGSCAQGLAVQDVIFHDNLIQNVREKGAVLEKQLRTHLSSHRYVGDIRGSGLFWGVSIPSLLLCNANGHQIEFVINKTTKEPFSPERTIAWKLHERGKSIKTIGLVPYQLMI
jgi:adenosylmethionine-8-amino-7-oxononanoate aminotransferase